MRRSVVRPKLVSKKWTSGMRISRSVIASIFTGVAPRFIPTADDELPIAGGILFVFERGEAAAESVEEELAVARLHLARSVTGGGVRLPGVDLGGNVDGQLRADLRRAATFEQID